MILKRKIILGDQVSLTGLVCEPEVVAIFSSPDVENIPLIVETNLQDEINKVHFEKYYRAAKDKIRELVNVYRGQGWSYLKEPHGYTINLTLDVPTLGRLCRECRGKGFVYCSTCLGLASQGIPAETKRDLLTSIQTIIDRRKLTELQIANDLFISRSELAGQADALRLSEIKEALLGYEPK
jgi:hypothetical protein